MKTFKQYLLEMTGQQVDTDLSPTERVRLAFKNLKEIDPKYYEDVFKQRSIKDDMAASSVYDMSPDELKSRIMTAEWEEYSHPSIKEPAVGFVTYDLVGILGMIDLKKALNDGSISYNDKITYTDPKNTGKAFPTMSGKRGGQTNVTVALLGPYPNKGIEVAFTFHPGEPSDVGVDGSGLSADMIGQTVTVREALLQGIKAAKVV